MVTPEFTLSLPSPHPFISAWPASRPHPQEAELVALARKGDRDALQSLLAQYLPTIYRFVAFRLGPVHPDIDDVVQETLISAINSVHRLRGDRDGAVPKWLLTIARRRLVDHSRRVATRQQVLLEDLPSAPSFSSHLDVQDIVAQLDRSRRLRSALATLTPDQEEVLTLRYILDYSINTTSAITNRTPAATKALQHRALINLQKLFAHQNQQDWS